MREEFEIVAANVNIPNEVVNGVMQRLVAHKTLRSREMLSVAWWRSRTTTGQRLILMESAGVVCLVAGQDTAESWRQALMRRSCKSVAEVAFR